jgi:FAD:protein FMN transferase
MRKTKLIMGMPICVEIIDAGKEQLIDKLFMLFTEIDNRFSTYKQTSEITAINNGLPEAKWSADMREIFRLSEQTKRQTDGYFDIHHNGKTDPSGMVKGWAIQKAAELLDTNNVQNYYIDAGGDIQTKGKNPSGNPWKVGIRNPYNRNEVIKTLVAKNMGIATSGTYIRGEHIYNPKLKSSKKTGIVSMTVIAPHILDADRFATAAFAMGFDGIHFVESMPDLEGYMVDSAGTATFTSGFHKFTEN